MLCHFQFIKLLPKRRRRKMFAFHFRSVSVLKMAGEGVMGSSAIDTLSLHTKNHCSSNYSSRVKSILQLHPSPLKISNDPQWENFKKIRKKEYFLKVGCHSEEVDIKCTTNNRNSALKVTVS